MKIDNVESVTIEAYKVFIVTKNGDTYSIDYGCEYGEFVFKNDKCIDKELSEESN